MTNFEFEQVMKTIDIGGPIVTTDRYGFKCDDIYYWQGITIYFYNNYVIVSGKIPFELVKTIYQKYPNIPYEMRIKGWYEGCTLVDLAVDEKYEKEINEYIENNSSECVSILDKFEKARKRLLRRNDGNKYIRECDIFTKEELVIFLTEMKDYYNRRNGLEEIETQKIDELMALVISKMLTEVNFNFTTSDFAQRDKCYSEFFSRALEYESKTFLGVELRKALDDFDKAINPFANKDIELDDPINYLKKIEITISDSFETKGTKSCLFRIKEPDSNNIVEYLRKTDIVSYKVNYSSAEHGSLLVQHYFLDFDEILLVDSSKGDSKERFEIIFNITRGIVQTRYNAPITSKEKKKIYNELIRATKLAATITTDNMKKTSCSRKLLPNKQ